MDYLEVALEAAKKERAATIQSIAELGAKVGKIKRQRAELLALNDFAGDSPEVWKLNERLHNARRVLSVLGKKKEHFDFLLSYFGAEEK